MSSPDKSSPDKLIYMANQIARFFESQGADKAVAGTAEHIKKFWDPRMRMKIVAHLKTGGSGLDPVARGAIEHLPEMKAAAPAVAPSQ
jgi:formate dehydrogenase subunit delta